MPDFFGERYKSKSLKITASVIVFVFLIPYTVSVYNGLSRLFAMAFNIVSTLIYVANLAKCQELLKGITVWEKTGAGLYYPNQQVASLILKQSTKKDVYRIPAL